MATIVAGVLVSTVVVGGPVSLAHASVPSNGTYDCNTGLPSDSTPNFRITSGVVSAGPSCVGAVVIPAGVTSIGSYAFSYAAALTSIIIPASVTSIGYGAFGNATSLASVTFDGTSTLTSIGEWAFSGSTALSSITIPAGVTSIGNGTFHSATALSSITIPAGVTSIANAFYGATSLASVYFLGNAPTTVGSNGFYNVAGGAKAYIKSDATGFPTVGAVWNRLTVAYFYNVTYDSTGGSQVAPGTFLAGGAISQAPTQPTQSGFTFVGWSTTDGGSALTFPYTPTLASDLTLYAQWAPIAVTFDANSGSGSMANQVAAVSTALTLNTFTRSGFTFAGWATAADGSGTSYADGESYGFTADLTLYAQWTAVVASPPVSSGGGESGSGAVQTDPAPVAVQTDPAPVRAVVVPPRRAKAVPAAESPAVIQRTQQSSGSSQPAEAVALVGGKEVAVKAATRGSQAASYGVGKVTVDVGVAAKDGAVDSVGGVPSLKIASNAPASLKGSGLEPNSKMQVFLPATDGSFIELPSVAVAADGSFDVSLTLGSSNRAKPMPIGKRFIQMVGLDEDGNETVLDIPVTIAQPLPAPEINRVSGQRPALTPGQALAFNAGAPETVALKRSSAATSVEGEDWVFTVAGSTTDASGQTLAFTRDAPVTFSGEGFMPGTRADVWMFSDPTLLGTVDIAEDGTFSANFAVDSNFVPTGNHTLQIQGVGDDGFVRAANLGVVVKDQVSTPLAPIDSDPIGWVPLMFIGTSVGGLLVLVGVTLAIRRGKRAKERLVPISL